MIRIGHEGGTHLEEISRHERDDDAEAGEDHVGRLMVSNTAQSWRRARQKRKWWDLDAHGPLDENLPAIAPLAVAEVQEF